MLSGSDKKKKKSVDTGKVCNYLYLVSLLSPGPTREVFVICINALFGTWGMSAVVTLDFVFSLRKSVRLCTHW